MVKVAGTGRDDAVNRLDDEAHVSSPFGCGECESAHEYFDRGKAYWEPVCAGAMPRTSYGEHADERW